MDAEPTDLNKPVMRLAGSLWLLAGICYLAAEAIAAAAFPGYSYARNYISDLGVPFDGFINGREIHSPMAPVINFGGFILDGLLSAAATVAAIAAIGVKRSSGTLFAGFALVHSTGSILVGTFHSGAHEAARGLAQFHVIGAAMAIIGGNCASIAAASLSRQFGAPPGYRMASRWLGICGLLGLALLEAGRASGLAIAPDGVLERGSVYAITLWKILTGLTIVAIWHSSRRRTHAD
ncbi:MAG: DUF998 domain-containing protein [Novosphingobium sp.]